METRSEIMALQQMIEESKGVAKRAFTTAMKIDPHNTMRIDAGNYVPMQADPDEIKAFFRAKTTYRKANQQMLREITLRVLLSQARSMSELMMVRQNDSQYKRQLRAAMTDKVNKLMNETFQLHGDLEEMSRSLPRCPEGVRRWRAFQDKLKAWNNLLPTFNSLAEEELNQGMAIWNAPVALAVVRSDSPSIVAWKNACAVFHARLKE